MNLIPRPQEQILLFSPREDDSMESSLPYDIVNKLRDKEIIAFVGRKPDGNGGCVSRLRFFSKAEWEAFLERIAKQYRPGASGMLNSVNALRYLQANSANCNLASCRLSLPAALAGASNIQLRARLFQEDGHWFIEPIQSKYSEENSSIPLLQDWLEVDHREESGTVWKGKAKLLETDYTNTINQYINALIEAYPKDLRRFSAEIFDTLSLMAANDDASSIDTTFWLCQSLNRTGYHPDVSPLGIAVEHGAIHAVDALLKNGMDISFCGTDSEHTTFQTAMLAFSAGNADDSFLLHLIECGAEIALTEVLGLYFFLDSEELAKKVVLCASSVSNNPNFCQESLLDAWDEILGDPDQLSELKGCIDACDWKRIPLFRRFIEACLQEIEDIRSQSDEQEAITGEEARADLQNQLLQNAELFAEQRRPELDFYRGEFSYFTAFLTEGDRIQHCLYGGGTVQKQVNNQIRVCFDSGDCRDMKTVDMLLNGEIVVGQEEFQCRLFFSRDILERGEGMEASFKEAMSRISLLKQSALPYDQLSKMQLFHTGAEPQKRVS